MEAEFELTNITRLGTKATPSDFELLKVLGQGSFGRVSPLFVHNAHEFKPMAWVRAFVVF